MSYPGVHMPGLSLTGQGSPCCCFFFFHHFLLPDRDHNGSYLPRGHRKEAAGGDEEGRSVTNNGSLRATCYFSLSPRCLYESILLFTALLVAIRYFRIPLGHGHGRGESRTRQIRKNSTNNREGVMSGGFGMGAGFSSFPWHQEAACPVREGFLYKEGSLEIN